MGYIALWIIISLIVAALTYATYSNEKDLPDRPLAVKFAFGAMFVVSAFFIGAYALTSYLNSVGLEGDYATISQYKEALKSYASYANIPSGANGKVISDLTDKKYEDYQENLLELVKDLRYRVTDYNKTLAEKRFNKQGWMFGCLTHVPDLKHVEFE